MIQKDPRKKAFRISLTGFFLFFAMTALLRAQTRDWQTLFRSTDNALNGGQGFIADSNGAVLAWNEGPLLKSYVQMYETYREPYYLRKLVAHFDQIRTYLKDVNNDGGLGWGSSNYTDEVLVNSSISGAGPDPSVLTINPGFETVDTATPSLPEGWTRTGKQAEVYRSEVAEDRRSGTAGLVVKTNGVSWRHGIQPLKNVYLPGQSYYLSFWGKTNGKVRGRVGVYDRTSGTVTLGETFFSQTDWASGSLTFTAPTIAGRDLYILCFFDKYTPTDGRVSFDDVRLSLIDPAHAADWREVEGAPETIRRVERTDCPSRPYCLEVTADGVGTAPAGEQELPLVVPGATYQAQVKSWGSSRIEILNGDSVIASQERLSGSWGVLKLLFTTPVSGKLKVRLTLSTNTGGAIARFDDASLKMETAYVVHQAVLLIPVLRFVRLVREDPRLQPEFGEKAENYLSLAVEDILPGWERDWREVGYRGFYVSNNQTDFGRPGETSDVPLPHNQYLPMAELFLDLWRLTGRNEYRMKAEKIGRSFKTFLKMVTGPTGQPVYLWHYADNLFQEGFDSALKAEDLNHANLDISAVLRMAEDNAVFTAEDMVLFARTLREVVWDGNITVPFMHSRVDGSNIVGLEGAYKYGMNEWVGLARYDAEIWPLVDRLYQGLFWGNGARLLTVSGLARYDPLQRPFDRTAPGNVTATALSSTTVYLAWTPPAGPTLNPNPGFENPDSTDPTLPAEWNRSGIPTQVFRSTAPDDRRIGNAVLMVKTNGVHWRQGIQGLTYTPGQTHLLTFWGKTNGRVRGRVGIYERTGGATIVIKDYFFSNTDWTPLSFRFTAPAESGRDLKLYCYFDDYRKTDGVVWFDEVRVAKEIAIPSAYIVYQSGVEKGSTSESPLIIRDLTAGTSYSFTVVAKDAEGTRSPESLESLVRTMPPSNMLPLTRIFPGSNPWNNVENFRAYPSPFRPGREAVGITFDQIPAEIPVRIYTIDGRPVKTLTTKSAGDVLWDLSNNDGNPVASGIYLAIVEKDGNRKKLKVIVQK